MSSMTAQEQAGMNLPGLCLRFKGLFWDLVMAWKGSGEPLFWQLARGALSF